MQGLIKKAKIVMYRIRISDWLTSYMKVKHGGRRIADIVVLSPENNKLEVCSRKTGLI